MSGETVALIGSCAAVAGVFVSILGGMSLLIYKAGRHAQRLEAAEDAIERLQEKQEEHSEQISGWGNALKLLEEVRKDVKDIVTGKVRLAQRPRSQE